MPFTTIKGVSERRRLPRLGKIRLGVKVLAQSGQTYPAEVDYFVVPPEVAKVYGTKPKALDVMFPVQDRGIIFPQALKWYGSGRGLKCVGDGERAMRLNEQTGAMEPRDCPCSWLDQGHCARRAHLMVILPKVNMGGVYQIDMGSYNSIVDLNSGLDYVEALVGRIAMVPLVLTRVPRETFGGGQRRMHYPLQVTLATNDIQWINRLRTETAVILERQAAFVLPAPVDENPAFDDEPAVVPESELPEGQAQGEAPQALPPTPPAIQPNAAGPPAASARGSAARSPIPAEPPKSAAAPAGPPPATSPVGRSRPSPNGQAYGAASAPATNKQVTLIRALAEERDCWGEYAHRVAAGLTKAQASRMIEEILKRPQPAQPAATEEEESYL